MANSSSNQVMGRVDSEPWRIRHKGRKGVARAKKELGKVGKLNPNQVTGRIESEPWWIGPKIGNLIPARRRLVKRLMLDWVVHLVGFASASASQEASKGGHEVALLPKVVGCTKIRKRVCPYPPKYGIGFD